MDNKHVSEPLAELEEYPINEGINLIRRYVLSNLDMTDTDKRTPRQFEQQPYESQPQAYRLIKQKVQELVDEHKRFLVLSKNNWSPQSSAVVTIDKVYDRFAQGHLTQRSGSGDEEVWIPYTINFYMFLSPDSKDIIEVED